jgi:transcriptional regulator with XRE-family HTH domain
MDNQSALRDFLVTRRNAITPQQAGLPLVGRRRVPGLRRDEVAGLAGVSVEYYTRLEQGKAAGVSEDVMRALAKALQMNDVEMDHFQALVRNLGSRPVQGRTRKPVAAAPRAAVEILVDSITEAAAVVRNERLDILAANKLGRALYAAMFRQPRGTVNHARFIFLDPASHEFHTNWDAAADDAVAMLRVAAGRDPFDRNLSNLIGELSTRSDDFRVRWAAHNVHKHSTGLKSFHHTAVGNLELKYEQLSFDADPGLSLLVYFADPGTPSHDALLLLEAWAASKTAAPQGS